MQDRIHELMDKIAGQAKLKAGELLESGRLEREGQVADRRKQAAMARTEQEAARGQEPGAVREFEDMAEQDRQQQTVRGQPDPQYDRQRATDGRSQQMAVHD